MLCSKVGKTAAWLTSVLVLVIFADVIVRYFFSASQAWITEFEWHLFALIFLLGAAFTFQDNEHVRVDLFYTKFTEKTKAWINLGGILVFLMPWCFVVIRASHKYALKSFQIGEGSPDPAGLPYRWIVKFAVVVGFVLLLLQAVSILLSRILVIANKRERIFSSETKQS